MQTLTTTAARNAPCRKAFGPASTSSSDQQAKNKQLADNFKEGLLERYQMKSSQRCMVLGVALSKQEVVAAQILPRRAEVRRVQGAPLVLQCGSYVVRMPNITSASGQRHRHHWSQALASMLGISLWDLRNGVLWCKAVEIPWEAGQITFLYTAGSVRAGRQLGRHV